MSRLNPRARSIRYVLVAIAAFMLGSGSVVLAAGTGAMQLPTFRIGDAANPDRMATVDASGNLHVSVSNQPSTQQISGSVSVSNFPATQQVSGTVSLPNQRVILLAENLVLRSDTPQAMARVDTGDCRSFVGMVRGQFSASDVTLELIQENPDASGFGAVAGTRLGIMTYFTVGGTNVIAPRASLSIKRNTDSDLTVDKLWLLCGH